MPEIWLSYNNNAEKIQIPVNPGELKIGNGSQNESVSVVDIGEITIKQDPTLKTFEFDSFFPEWFAPYVGVPESKLMKPWEYIKLIELWKAKDNPVRFIVTGTNINFPVTIEGFNYSERGGDVGTLYYTLQLKEYKFIKVRQVNMNIQRVVAPNPRPSPPPQPRTYTVVRGDCLWAIARNYYGDGSKYTVIYDANKSVIGGNPNLIHPGQVFVIP